MKIRIGDKVYDTDDVLSPRPVRESRNYVSTSEASAGKCPAALPNIPSLDS